MNKHKPELKLVNGGLNPVVPLENRIFHSARITNSYMRGYLWIRIRWDIKGRPENIALYQYFVINVEAKRFESFQKEVSEINDEEKDLADFCADRTKWKSMDEDQISTLMHYFVRAVSNSSNYFPGGYDEYEIFQKSSLLDSGDDDEMKNIFLKLLPSSIPGKSLINYLLVLISQEDSSFAKYLFHGDIPDSLVDAFANSTIYKIVQNEGGLSSSLAQVFYEQAGLFYRTIISFDVEYDVAIPYVSECNIVSRNMISGFEMLSINRATEYVVRFTIATMSAKAVVKVIAEHLPFMRPLFLLTGTLLAIPNSTEKQFDTITYRFIDSMEAEIFVTDYQDLIICTKNKKSMKDLVYLLSESPLSLYLRKKESFSTEEELFEEFTKGHYIDFADFLKEEFPDEDF